jgi:hypothetical protein
MLRVGAGFAKRERAAGLDDVAAKQKPVTLRGREQVDLEFDGQDVGARRAGISVNAAMPQALSSPAVMIPA